MTKRYTFFKSLRFAVVSICFAFSCSASFLEKDLAKLNETNACPCGKLAGVDLSGRTDVINLRSASLIGANLQETTLTKDALYGADLRYASLPSHLEELLDTWNIPGRAFIGIDIEQTPDMSEDCTLKTYDQLILLANEGDPFALSAVAFILEIYGTEENDKTKARDYYEKAVDQNYWPALNNLGWIYEWGYGVDRDLEKARDYYQKAAPHDLFASFNLTRFYAIHENDREACYSLGSKYKSGNGVPQDMRLAFHWIQKAAEGGHIKACRYAGLMSLKGTGTDRNPDEAFRYLKKGADPKDNNSGEQGDPEAQYEFGHLFETINGFEPARFWYEQASKVDHKNALLHLGKLYEEGQGGKICFDDALVCYQKAAAQGSITGLFNAGKLIGSSGGDTEKQEAIWYYQNVLIKDPTHRDALVCLATHYEVGVGVEKNLPLANMYYEQAAQQGYVRSSQNRNLYSEALSVPEEKKSYNLMGIGLFSGKTSLFSSTIRFATRSNTSHVGLILSDAQNEKSWYFYESSRTGGVNISPWETKVRNYEGKVSYRLMIFDEERVPAHTVSESVEEYNGNAYPSTFIPLIRGWLGLNREKTAPERPLFCSELVAQVLKDLRLMFEDKASGNIIPSHFESEEQISLAPGLGLTPAFFKKSG